MESSVQRNGFCSMWCRRALSGEPIGVGAQKHHDTVYDTMTLWEREAAGGEGRGWKGRTG